MSSVISSVQDTKECASTDKKENKVAEHATQNTCQTFAPVPAPVVQATSYEAVDPANSNFVFTFSSIAEHASKALVVKTTSNSFNNLTDIDAAVAEFHAELQKEYRKTPRHSHNRSKSATY